MPATEATLTIAPFRRLAIRTPAARATRKVPRRSMLTSRSHCSMHTRSSECILPNTPAALTRAVMGPWVASISAILAVTPPSLATSKGAGQRTVFVPARGSGAISTMMTRCPRSASKVAVAAPMPRLPPVTSTRPSALIAILPGRIEQPARDQLAVGGDDVIRHGGDALCGIGIMLAQITARAHEDVYDGFEFLVAVIVDRARLPRPLEDAHIGGRDIVQVLLIADRREQFRLIEDAQEFRHLADEIEERAKALDLLPCR